MTTEQLIPIIHGVIDSPGTYSYYSTIELLLLLDTVALKLKPSRITRREKRGKREKKKVEIIDASLQN